MDAAKNTDYIKKFFKQKLLRIKFPTKNFQWTCIFISPRSIARKLQRFANELDRILMEIRLKLKKKFYENMQSEFFDVISNFCSIHL